MSDAALLTPVAVRIAEQYDDGLDARHYRFEPLVPSARECVAKPGQFFMLTLPGHGEAAFTYVRAPDARGSFEALIRKVGGLTTALLQQDEGVVLGARGPFGRGWPIEEVRGGRVLIGAGGCGLAPLCPAIDALARDGASRVALIYGSRDEALQVLHRERESWQGLLPVLTVFDHPSQPGHFRGTPLSRLDAALEALGGGADHALVCGPEPMMLATAAALAKRGVRHDHIWLSLERRMHCGVGLCGHCYVAHTYACRQGPTYRYDELLALLAKSPQRPPLATEIHHC